MIAILSIVLGIITFTLGRNTRDKTEAFFYGIVTGLLFALAFAWFIM